MFSPERKKEEENAQNGLPFKKLKDNEFCDYKHFIWQVADDPDVVVRRENHSYGERPARESVPLGEKIEYHKQAREKLTELAEKYGLHIPNFKYVVGQDNEHNAPAFYTVTEKIHGSGLETALEEMKGEREKEKLENLFLSLIKYANDVNRNGGKFFWDIFHAGQYKYGVRRGETENNIYLVDLEPWMAERLPPGGESKNVAKFYVAMHQLQSFIQQAEEETGERLASVRQKLAELLDNIPPDDPDREEYRKLRSYLN